jgi:hypothetical protein
MMQAAMMAHIAEHVGYAYRQKIEQQLGYAIACPKTRSCHQRWRLALSGMMAQAAKQVLQQSQGSCRTTAGTATSTRPSHCKCSARSWQLKEQEVQIKAQKAQTMRSWQATRTWVETARRSTRCAWTKAAKVDFAAESGQHVPAKGEDPHVAAAVAIQESSS